MLLVIVLVVSVIKCSYSNWPLTLLAEYRNNSNLVDIQCVAYNISDDSVLTWVRTINSATHLNAIRKIVSSKFKKIENFEETSNDSAWTSSWKIADSNSHPLYFVTDHRWEDFPIHNRSKNYKLQNNLLNIGLSLLSNNDFNIQLSRGYQNFSLARYNSHSISYCKFSLCSYVPLYCINDKQLFSNSTMWMQINILWRDGNLLIEGNDNVCGVDGIKFDKQINVALAVIGELILWKTHDYKFLWTSIQPDNSEQIGPIISNKLKKHYIFMYVALCENCTMDITIVSRNAKKLNQYNNKAGKHNVKDGKYVWKRIKMEINGSSDISIYIKTQKTDNISNGFWAIDDIRFGNLTEFQVTKTSVRDNYLYEWQCHKLNNFESVQFMNEISTVNSNNVDQLCPLIYENKKYCEGNKICNFGSNVSQCYCAPGYKGEKCSQECKVGWGLNCREACGQCSKGTCHHINGTCMGGCKFGYNEPKCEVNTPIILNSPALVTASAIFLILALKNKDYKGTLLPKYIQYQYMITGDVHWTSEEKKLFKYALDNYTIKWLTTLTEYKVRAILYTDKDESYQEDDVPLAIYKTTCIGAEERDISINATGTTAQVNIMKNSPNSCPDSVYSAVIQKINKSISEITEQIKNLLVYTNYTIVLNNTVLNQTIGINFTTLAGVPGKVENLKIDAIKSNSALITWNAPSATTGSSLSYKVKLSHQQHKSCNETKKRPKDLKLDISNGTTTYMAQYLIPYSFYKVKVAAVNEAGPGMFVSGIFNTKAEDFLTDEEFPVGSKISKISGSTFQLELSQPECDKIIGPILYDIRFNCTNKWCIAVNHTVNYTLGDTITKTNITLIPFSDYNWQLLACRNTCSIVPTTSFHTDPSRPLKVRDLQLYTKDENSLSFRFKKPYPPYGKLETYYISCCISYQPCEKVEPKPVISCELWEDSDCFTVGNLKENQFYECQIYATNEDVIDDGAKINITRYTSQETPGEPPLFNCTWEENDILVLTWEHPTISNGPIKKFVINFNVVRSLYTNASSSIEIPVTKIQKTYSYEIRDFRNATEYIIGIYGVNKFIGRSSFETVISPPPIPNFRETPVLICENNICDIKTGLIDNLILNSSLWIVINNTDPNLIITNKTSLQKKGPELHTKEIFKRLNITETEQYITSYTKVGRNATELKLSKGSFLNPKIKINETVLMSEPPILMHAILLSDYLGVVSMKIYQLKYPNDNEIPSFDSSVLYWLILLAIIPIAIGIWYMHKKRQNNKLFSENPWGTSAGEPSDSPQEKFTRQKLRTFSMEGIPLLQRFSGNSGKNKHVITRKHFQEYVKNSIISVNGAKTELEKQHESITNEHQKSWDYGLHERNKHKNRFNNLIAYDHSRVILEKINNDAYSDYINASYIDGYNIPKAYIATQGPKPTTVNDFWRMICQEKLKTIVMLTKLKEGGKTKCAEYWPELHESVEYGRVIVTTKKENKFVDYTYRTFVVSEDGTEFETEHLHFTSWPDHGVPQYPQSLVPFIKKILAAPLPIVVHCSAGIGRTGTIILCDYNLRMVANTDKLEFYETVKKFRQQRPNMVNNVNQYKLAHLLILEVLYGLNTELSCDNNLNEAINQIIAKKEFIKEMDYLDGIMWQDHILTESYPRTMGPELEKKNRFPEIIPSGSGCIYLNRYPAFDEHSDYINAVLVDQYEIPDRFIVTQQPLPETVGDFWRMVLEKDVAIIVSLNDIIPSDQTSCAFWPTEEITEMNPVPFITLKFIKKQKDDIATVVTISLNNANDEEDSVQKIEIIIMSGWLPKKRIPKTVNHLLAILEIMNSMSRNTNPIVITCHDGATASGLFVAVSFVIERIKLEKICDVCQAVRIVRRNRLQFVTDEKQFEFLYRAVLTYLSDFETYSNFL